MQPDGAVLLFGASGATCASDASVIKRITPAGTLDGTFGTAGVVTDDLSVTWSDEFLAGDVLAGGDIVAGGAIYGGNCNVTPTGSVQRRTSTGALVGTWGTGGRFQFGFGSRVLALLGAPDGSLYVAGNDTSSAPQRCFVARLTPAGTLDPTFGTAGVMRLAGFTSWCATSGLVRLPDGALVLAGSGKDAGPSVGMLARITGAGALDPTFGTAGIASQTLNAGDVDYSALALQGDGRIVVVGTALNAGGQRSMLAARYLATGVLDASFGSSGTTLVYPPGGARNAIPVTSISSRNVAVDRDGSVLFATTGGTPYDRTYVARVSSTGVLDTAFGTNGVAMLDFSPNASWPLGIFPVSDGGVTIAGMSGGGSSMAIQRLVGLPVPDYDDATRNFTIGSAMFGACLRAVSAGATTNGTTWTPHATCPATSGTYWHPVGATAAAVAVSTASGTTGMAADLRFAFRPATNQPPGNYVAPIVFTVTAPS